MHSFTYHDAVSPASADPLIALLLGEGAFADADALESYHESGCHRTRPEVNDRDPAFPDRLGASPAELAEFNFSTIY
jgi:hypothetical protein